MDVRPQDLPEIRAELLAWMNAHGPAYFAACIASGAQRVFFPSNGPEVDGQWFATTDAARLAKAELYWISPEMTELCVTAAKSMPDWQLEPEDLPSSCGLMYFDGLVPLRPDYPSTAFSWGPCPYRVARSILPHDSGMWLSAYTDVATDHQLGSLDLSAMQIPMPRLLYAGESASVFGRREEGWVSLTTVDGEEVATEDDELLRSRVGSLALVKAAWLLMQQGLAEVSEVKPDRAASKRLRRAGQDADLNATRVIELRRPKHNGEPGESNRTYTHRWITRGHWRQQWYPARQVHRPVWIAPHVKGPEGAPMIGGEKVYAWKR